VHLYPQQMEEANTDTRAWLSSQQSISPFPTTDNLSPFQTTHLLTQRWWASTLHDFETYLGVKSAAWKKIIYAVDPKWLEAIRHPQMGFSQLTPKQIIDHLRTVSRDLDYTDVTNLMKQLTMPWDINKKLIPIQWKLYPLWFSDHHVIQTYWFLHHKKLTLVILRLPRHSGISKLPFLELFVVFLELYYEN
jgi:hypothetical protein